jgi:hypothetical protein
MGISISEVRSTTETTMAICCSSGESASTPAHKPAIHCRPPIRVRMTRMTADTRLSMMPSLTLAMV